MIGASALLLAAVQGIPGNHPPTDWTLLAPLPWKAPPHIDPDVAGFVGEEVRAGRCVVAPVPGTAPGPASSAAAAMTVELAVFMRETGTVRAVVPRAIGCPTVEQFAAGLVYSMARGNLRRTTTGWYHAQLVFPLAQ